MDNYKKFCDIVLNMHIKRMCFMGLNMKADYKNWVPEGILITMAVISALLLLFSIGFSILIDGKLGITLSAITFAAFLISAATSIKLFRMHQAFPMMERESFLSGLLKEQLRTSYFLKAEWGLTLAAEAVR